MLESYFKILEVRRKSKWIMKQCLINFIEESFSSVVGVLKQQKVLEVEVEC